MTGRWAAFLCALLFACLPVAAAETDEAPGRLTAGLEPPSAPVGGMATLTLRYHLPEKAHLPPDPPIGGLQGLTVLDRKKAPGEIRVTLLVDRIGRFRTGPITLGYLSEDGEEGLLRADPVELTVISNLGEKPEEARLRPIRGIIPTKSRLIGYVPWLIGLVLVCAAGVVLFLWLKKRRVTGLKIIDHDPPHKVAMREIEELKSLGLFEKGRVKEFYFRLSQIMRRYMEALRGFPAAEYTTEEIALALREEEDRRLLPLLRHADLVKFADLRPMKARKDEQIEEALLYIERTCAAFEVPGEGGGTGSRADPTGPALRNGSGEGDR